METPVTSLGTRSGVHWMRRKARSSERATARASVVFPTPGTSSSRTWPSTRSAPSSCSVTSRFPTTTAPMCSTRRSVAPRTVSVTRELCSLQFRDGGSTRRGPTANHARGHERDGEADEGSHGVQREHDRILLAHRERSEGPLDEEDEGDPDECSEGHLSTVHRPRRDRECDGREDVDDPSPSVSRRGPGPPAGNVAFVDPVRDECEGEGERHAPDEPGTARGDRTAAASHGLGVLFGFRACRARALEREERVDVRRRIAEPPH